VGRHQGIRGLRRESRKIFQIGDSYLAITGSTTLSSSSANTSPNWHAAALRLGAEYFSRLARTARGDEGTLFSDRFEDKEDDLETSRFYVLIANPHGIFGVAPHRAVQEFSKFYAYGAGADYALGALYATYDHPS